MSDLLTTLIPDVLTTEVERVVLLEAPDDADIFETITENVLTMLGRKMSSGRDLTMSERLMAMTATAQTTSNRYGPGPADMVVQQPELPETVKGVLANYTGV